MARGRAPRLRGDKLALQIARNVHALPRDLQDDLVAGLRPDLRRLVGQLLEKARSREAA